MPDIVIIAGAPGSGKSSIAALLQAQWRSPCFEFGTFCLLPEYDAPDGGPLSWPHEEALIFQNLMLVVRNYLRHGYRNIIVTDLQDFRLRQMPRLLKRYDFAIVTLTVSDDAVLRERVLDETRSSGYRDYEAALTLNAMIRRRAFLPNECRVDVTHTPALEVARQISALVCRTGERGAPNPRRRLPPLSDFAAITLE